MLPEVDRLQSNSRNPSQMIALLLHARGQVGRGEWLGHQLNDEPPSTPGQIVVAQGQVPITLAGDLKDRIGNAGLQRGAAVVTHATQPMPGLEEGDVDFRRIFPEARQRESVEVVLGNAPVYDV